MADDAYVQFGAQIAGLTSGLQQATSQVTGFVDRTKAAVGSLATPFAQLQSAIIGVAAIAAGGMVFKSFVDEATTAASEVLKLSKSLGINQDAANLLRVQLAATGNTVDDYVSASLKLDRQVRQNEETIRKTGMATRDSNGQFLNGQQLMANAISTLAQYKQGTDRNIASQVIFGRGAGEIASLMKLNAESAERAARDMKELGLAVTPQDSANAKAYKVAINELELSFSGIKKAIGEAVLPYLTAFANWFRSIAPGLITNMKDTTKAVIEWAFDFAQGFVEFVHSVLDGVLALAAGWTFVRQGLGMIDNAGAAATMNTLAGMSDKLAQLRERALGAVSAVRAAVLSGSAVNAPIPDAGGGGTKNANNLTAESKKAGEIAKIRLEADRAVAKVQFDEQKSNLDAQVAQYKITENQKYALLIKFTNDQYAADMALLDKEQKALAGDAVKREQVLGKIKVAREKHEFDLQRINEESIAKQQAKYEQLFATIQGAWDSQLRGLLAGTTTWAQAWKNILADLTIQFIQFAEKTALNWAAAELAKTTATTTGVAARTAAESAGAATSIFSSIANAIKSILSSVGVTIAGVTANQAPIVGPLAPAEGIAAGVATMAAATAVLPSFDVGAWRIPRDTAATVHRDEMIIPAAPARALRAAMGSGDGAGDTFHVAISALDAGGVHRWAMKNRDVLTKAVRASARDQNHR